MFNLNDLNPASKFYFDEEEKEWVELRLCPEGKQNEFRLKAGIKSKREYKWDKKGNPVPVDSLENDDEKMLQFVDFLNDYQIKNWYIVDQNGNEIPCTLENKKLMMDECPQFSEPVTSWVEQLQKDKKKDDEEELKNF